MLVQTGVSLVTYDTAGFPRRHINVSPHMKVKDLFSSVDVGTTVFVGNSRQTPFCPDTPVGDTRSNVILALKKISSKDHDLICPYEEVDNRPHRRQQSMCTLG